MMSDMEIVSDVEWEVASPGRLMIDIPEEPPSSTSEDNDTGCIDDSLCYLSDFIPNIDIQSYRQFSDLEYQRDHSLLNENQPTEIENIEEKTSSEQLSSIDDFSILSKLPTLSAVESKISYNKIKHDEPLERFTNIDKRARDNSPPPLESLIKYKVPLSSSKRTYTKKSKLLGEIEKECQQKITDKVSQQKRTKKRGRPTLTNLERSVKSKQEQARRSKIEQEQVRRVEIQLEQTRREDTEEEQARRLEIEQKLIGREEIEQEQTRKAEIELEVARRVEKQLKQIRREYIEQEQRRRLDIEQKEVRKIKIQHEQSKIKQKKARKMKIQLEQARRAEIQHDQAEIVKVHLEEIRRVEIEQKQARKMEIPQEQATRAEIEHNRAKRVEMQLEQMRRVEIGQKQAREIQIEPEQARKMEIQEEQARRTKIEHEQAKKAKIEHEQSKRVEMQLEQIRRAEYERERIQCEIQQKHTNKSNIESGHNTRMLSNYIDLHTDIATPPTRLDKRFSNFKPSIEEITMRPSADSHSVFCFHCSASIQKHLWINHKSKANHIMNVIYKESEIFAKFCFVLKRVASFESFIHLKTEVQGLFGNLVEITENSLLLIVSWLIKALTMIILNLVKKSFFSISVDHFSKLLIIRTFTGERICDYFLPGYFAIERQICYLHFLQTYGIHQNDFVVAFNLHPCLNCVTQRQKHISNIDVMAVLKPSFANIAFWLKTSKHIKSYCSLLDALSSLYKKYSEYFSLIKNSQILRLPLYHNRNVFLFVVQNKYLIQETCQQIYSQHCCFAALGITKHNFEFSKALEITIHLLSLVEACEAQSYENLSMNNKLLKTLNDIVPNSSSSRSSIESPTQHTKFRQEVCSPESIVPFPYTAVHPQQQAIQSSSAQQQVFQQSWVEQQENDQGSNIGQQLRMGNLVNGVPLSFPSPSYTPSDDEFHPLIFTPDHEAMTEVKSIIDLYLQEIRSPIYLNNRLTYKEIKFLFDLKNLEKTLRIKENIETLIILFHKFMIKVPFHKLLKFLTSFAIDVQFVTLRFPMVQGIIDSLNSILKMKDYSICLKRFYYCLATLPIYPTNDNPMRIPALKIANCVLKKRFGALLSPLLLGCMVACPSSQADLQDIRNTMFYQFNEQQSSFS